MFRTTNISWSRRLALGLAGLLAAALFPAFAQEEPPVDLLVPNIEPAELAVAEIPAWRLSEREAVEAALAAYAAQSSPAPPEGALLDLPPEMLTDDTGLQAIFWRIYLPAVRRSAAGAPTPTPVTPTPDRGTPATVTATIWPKPSILVAGGTLLEYEIRLANSGNGEAKEVKVVFPLNRQHYTLEYTSLDTKAGDWVSTIGQDSFTITFGKLVPETKRSGKVFLRVKSGLALQTVLNVRASYSWSDKRDGGDQRSNWAPVVIGSGPSDAPYIWLKVEPDRGPAGTRHTFITNRFLPGEVVTSWLNTPQGVRSLDLRGTADTEGSISLSFNSSGLVRGAYQIVLYGNRSALTGVATFIVQ